MEVYCAMFVCLLGLLSSGQGLDPTSGEGNRLERLQVEVAMVQEEIFHEKLEIQEWTEKLERLKENISELKKEKEFIQNQGKFSFIYTI